MEGRENPTHPFVLAAVLPEMELSGNWPIAFFKALCGVHRQLSLTTANVVLAKTNSFSAPHTINTQFFRHS